MGIRPTAGRIPKPAIDGVARNGADPEAAMATDEGSRASPTPVVIPPCRLFGFPKSRVALFFIAKWPCFPLPNGPDFDCQAENGVTLLALFFIAKWPRFHLPKTIVDIRFHFQLPGQIYVVLCVSQRAPKIPGSVVMDGVTIEYTVKQAAIRPLVSRHAVSSELNRLRLAQAVGFPSQLGVLRLSRAVQTREHIPTKPELSPLALPPDDRVGAQAVS